MSLRLLYLIVIQIFGWLRLRVLLTRQRNRRFSSLNSGMPRLSRPPGASSRSKTVSACPARVGCWAAAIAAGREPITATRRRRRVQRHNPSRRVRPVDDLHLDLLDRDGIGVDPEHAGGFARRWAKPPGELGEVARGVQPVGGIPPFAPPDQVVHSGSGSAAGRRCGRTGCRSACTGLPAAPGGWARTARTPRASPQPDLGRAAGRGLARRGQEALRIGHRPHPCAAAMTASLTSRPSRSACEAADSTRL